jgi:hypothetical protein
MKTLRIGLVAGVVLGAAPQDFVHLRATCTAQDDA